MTAVAPTEQQRIVVVGASAAGLAVAETLRRSGHRGSITLIGAERHAPYDRPPLSKQILAGEWDGSRLPLRPADTLAALGLDLRLGTVATGVDLAARTVALAAAAGSARGDGEGDTAAEAAVCADRVPYDSLVIATGVRPRRLPGEGAHVLRTLDDALTLRERIKPGSRLIVVGAGFLGAEAAAVASGLGAHVILLEPAPVPMAHVVGEPVGAAIGQAHREHGVDLRTGIEVMSVAKDGVLLADGSILEADAVLVAVGSMPNTEWLEDSGLTLGDGVHCDARGCAAPAVYAAGDVARWHNPRYGVDMRIEHRTNAAEMGMAVARNILSPDTVEDFAPVPYFWSDQYDLRIQAYGYLRGHEEIDIVHGGLAERRFVAAYRTADRLSGVLVLGLPPRALRPWRQAAAAGIPWDARTSVEFSA
ncbi:MAG TPA: FAD-dependent oxidoreductase [Actinospica sp.]|nr:FAD-dependent oxidoreductase [Actinospica sp.]